METSSEERDCKKKEERAALAAKRANRIVGCIEHSMSEEHNQSEEVILIPYLALV